MSQRDFSGLAAGLNIHRSRLEKELEEYYGSFNPYTEELLNKLDNMLFESAGASSYELKTRMYELLSEACPVHLFDNSISFLKFHPGVLAAVGAVYSLLLALFCIAASAENGFRNTSVKSVKIAARVISAVTLP